MWARVMEFVLACWLVLSRFIFRYAEADTFLWVNDLVCAALVMVAAFLSFWRPLRHLHLAIVPVALWLLAAAFAQPEVLPPHRNYVVVGVLLLVFAIVPSRASEPPRSWSAYMKNSRRHE